MSGKFAPFAILAAGLIATHQFWKAAENEAMLDRESEFASHVLETVGKIEKRMEIYEQVLIGVDGLITHDNKITRDKYARYIN